MTVLYRSLAVTLLAISLISCESKTATITVDPGLGGQHPYVNCDVGVPNPDYVPPSASVRP